VDPVVSRGSFDYRYDGEGRVEVPSDGTVHRVTVVAAETDAKLSWLTVPREETSVFRMAEFDNPHASPLLTGPVEVYSEGALVTSTTISRVGQGGAIQLGLGVDERIRVARNARVDEESAGLLGGKRAVLHQIDIELRSNLGFDAEIEVLDRVPVSADDGVEVEFVDCEPPHQAYDQRSRGAPIKGGMRWRIELDGGQTSSIRFSYVIKLKAKAEIVGGNRRE